MATAAEVASAVVTAVEVVVAVVTVAGALVDDVVVADEQDSEPGVDCSLVVDSETLRRTGLFELDS